MIEKVERETDRIGRHLEIFRLVLTDGPIGIVNLSDATGYPKHKIRYSLRILEEEALIEPTESGAVPTEIAREFLSTHPQRIDGLIEQLQATASEFEPVQA